MLSQHVLRYQGITMDEGDQLRGAGWKWSQVDISSEMVSGAWMEGRFRHYPERCHLHDISGPGPLKSNTQAGLSQKGQLGVQQGAVTGGKRSWSKCLPPLRLSPRVTV